ncbi:MAG: succinate dehydrogenase assembly factor 2 [Methylotenera sp.]|nr:succinate dehydrogenase assembly factor 2 [Methylotenera sp.]NOT64692.1 succinate dehydrogenase assembly factor 2 [Methylotenera sp.]
MVSSNMTDEEVRRLSWRCRRGLLELDIILQRFSENHLASVSRAELAAFDRLLDLPDNEFLDVVTNRVNAPSTGEFDVFSMKKILEKLRQS